MKIKKSNFIKFLYIIFIPLIAIHVKAQLPQNIEPGQHQESVSIFEQPEYIALIILLLVLLIGYYVYRRRKK